MYDNNQIRNNQQQIRPGFVPGQLPNNQSNQINIVQQNMTNAPPMNNLQQMHELPQGAQQY